MPPHQPLFDVSRKSRKRKRQLEQNPEGRTSPGESTLLTGTTSSLRQTDPGFRLQLSRADLRSAKLVGANLKGANLREARLIAAILQQADLLEADLSNAWLAQTNLIQANLSGANLRDAAIHSCDLFQARLGPSLSNQSCFRRNVNGVCTRLSRVIHGSCQSAIMKAATESSQF